MLKYFAAAGSLLLITACASGSGPRVETSDPQQERTDSIEPIDESKPVCGWSDTGRWECAKAARSPLDKKKPKSKFSTEFKKGPPKEKESKLPRGDKPFDADPIDDGGAVPSDAPTDDDMN